MIALQKTYHKDWSCICAVSHNVCKISESTIFEQHIFLCVAICASNINRYGSGDMACIHLLGGVS